MNPIIKVKNVSKIFEIPHEKRNALKDMFLNPFKRIKKDMYHALDDISFDVMPGEFVAVIGRNGSGKSTLLKLLAQIYEPTQGKVSISGSLVPFLELGVGFNPELSGRENVFLNGTILGMTRGYLRQKFDEIVDFAEVRDFIDLPVKNYSSGMAMRLAFSVAVQAKADIYLLDEVLSVGDVGFQAKSLAKMQELLSGGATVVLVSHSVTDVLKYASRVIYLNNGKVEIDGDVKTGVKEYYKEVYGVDMQIAEPNTIQNDKIDIGDGRAKIKNVKIFNSKDKVAKKLSMGESITIEFEAEVNDHISNPLAYVGLHNEIDKWLLSFNTARFGENKIGPVKKGDKIKVQFTGNINLNPGIYYLWAHLGDPKVEGKGTDAYASCYQNLEQIEVINNLPQVDNIVNVSGLVSHKYSYQIKISE